MEPAEAHRVAADHRGEHRDGREDAAARNRREAGLLEQAQVFGDRTIARVFLLARRANQAAGEQEVDARLQVREVRHRDQQLAVRLQHAVQFAQRARLLLVGEVLEHVEAQRAIERSGVERQFQQRRLTHVRRRVVRIDAGDRQPARVLLDQHALAAAGVEHARARRQRAEPGADDGEFREIGGEVVPGSVRRAVIVTALRVFARSDGTGVADRAGLVGRLGVGHEARRQAYGVLVGTYGFAYFERSGSTGVAGGA